VLVPAFRLGSASPVCKTFHAAAIHQRSSIRRISYLRHVALYIGPKSKAIRDATYEAKQAIEVASPRQAVRV